MVNKRSFQHHWFEKYPWLDYGVEEDSVTCFFCKRLNLNLLSERCRDETFLKTGYKNWKKATEKFDKHQQSKYRKSALTYEVIVPQCRNALEIIDENEKKRRERIFLTILEIFSICHVNGWLCVVTMTTNLILFSS